ncbi:MAG: hypothetical protein JWM88_489 [Verrucomicrobia bacterium]|nr:hypothetical protein [Verrucomicrobiota bacterium]
MKLSEFTAQLAASPEAEIVIALPGGAEVPRHFHVTEVGHVAKNFVDCGGKFRSTEACVLQAWTSGAADDGHRLTAGKLARILGLAAPILPSAELPVEVEFEHGVVSQFPIEEITTQMSTVRIRLGEKHTDCLARELCGVPQPGGYGSADSAQDAECCPTADGTRCC